MENNLPSSLPARSGTVGGIIFCLLLQVQVADLAKTAVLAATGATVSFLVSLLLQYLLKKRWK